MNEVAFIARYQLREVA